MLNMIYIAALIYLALLPFMAASTIYMVVIHA